MGRRKSAEALHYVSLALRDSKYARVKEAARKANMKTSPFCTQAALYVAGMAARGLLQVSRAGVLDEGAGPRLPKGRRGSKKNE
jgi:hypothetical protein